MSCESSSANSQISSRIRFALIFFAGVLVCLHLTYVAMIRPDVAYMDTLRWIAYYPDVRADPWRIFSYWEQGQHRGLWSQLVLWFNIRFLGMNILAANLLTAIVLFSICATLISQANDLTLTGARTWVSAGIALTLGLLSVFVIFSPAAFELFTLDIGFPEITRNLVFILSLVLLERWLKGSLVSRAWWPIVTLTVVFDFLVIGYGRSFPFAAAVTGLVLCMVFARKSSGISGRRVGYLVALCVMLLYVYMAAGSQPLLSMGRADGYSALGIAAAAQGVLVGIGSVFIGVETAQTLGLQPFALLLLGLFFLLTSAVVAWLYLYDVKDQRSCVPIALVVYGLSCAAAVGITRGGDSWGPAASRYYPDVALAAAGLLWAAATVLTSRQPPLDSSRVRASAAVLVAVAALGLFAGHFATYYREWRLVPARASAFNEMRDLTVKASIKSERDWRLLQHDEFSVKKGIEVQHRLCLGPVKLDCRSD